jgi:hypothetical protein
VIGTGDENTTKEGELVIILGVFASYELVLNAKPHAIMNKWICSMALLCIMGHGNLLTVE